MSYKSQTMCKTTNYQAILTILTQESVFGPRRANRALLSSKKSKRKLIKRKTLSSRTRSRHHRVEIMRGSRRAAPSRHPTTHHLTLARWRGNYSSAGSNNKPAARRRVSRVPRLCICRVPAARDFLLRCVCRRGVFFFSHLPLF